MSLEIIKRRVRQVLDARGVNMKRASLEAELGETFVRDLLERDRDPSASKLRQLAQSLGVTLAWLVGDADDPGEPGAYGDLITIPELDVRLSAGPGSFIEHENQVGIWQMSRRYLTDELRVNPVNLAVVEVTGDSMVPTLHSGDRVIIDHSDQNIGRPGVYAIWDSNATVVKRLEVVPYSDPPMIVLISDNKNHNQYTVPADQVQIIGRVVWYARRL